MPNHKQWMLELNIFVSHCFVGKIYFICSQKKNTQLVYRGYIYNKKTTQLNGNSTWRCLDLSKTRCKAIVRTQLGRLIGVREKHHHGPHTDRLNNRFVYRTEQDCYEQKNPFHLKFKKRQTSEPVTSTATTTTTTSIATTATSDLDYINVEDANLYGCFSETEDWRNDMNQFYREYFTC